MTIVAVVSIAAVASVVALLNADRRTVALTTGLIGLLAVAVASLVMEQSSITLAGVVLAPGPFCRLVLALGAAAGLALTVIGLASSWAGLLPAAMLGTLAALGIALSSADPIVATAAAGVAGVPGVLVALRGPGHGEGYLAAAGHARVVVLAVALAIVAAVVVGRQPGGVDDAALGTAYLAVALAVALRLGAVPFHVPTARLARSAPTIALPLLLAWAPAGLAAVMLAWTDGFVAPLALPLGTERTLIVAVAAVSLVVAPVAAWLAEDVDRAVGYLTIQAAAYLVLAMAALDPAAWQPARTWLLVYVLITSALAGWAVAVRAAFGTGRIEALDGWARRAPLLAVALLAVAVAVVGWPGSPALDSRLAVSRLAAGSDAVGTLLVVAGLTSLATFGRLAVRGLARPGPAVSGGSDERIRRPLIPAPPPGARMRERVAAAREVLRDGWRLDRGVVAAALVLVLAAGSLVAAAGGLGIPAAAAAPGPAAAGGDLGPSPGTVGQ